MTLRLFSSLIVLTLFVPSAFALDTVKTAKALVSGSLQSIDKYTVKIKRTGDREEEIPVNEIESIRLDGEPATLNIIRSAVNGGRYQDALDGLDKLKEDGLKADVKVEMAYFRAAAASRLALAGEGSIKDAGTLMNAFVTNNPTSWHYLEACEILGDLLVAINNFPLAEQRYSELEKAPWVDMKMRGGVLKGRALQGAGKFDEAAAAFDKVLTLAGTQTGELVDAQRLSATIGKGICLAQTGKSAEASKLLEEVIAKADPEQTEMHALAYNALGSCYRKAGNPKAALLAYLHVDVLYNTYPNAHAEALASLAELWKEVGNPVRGEESQQVLAERYPTSKWAKK